MAPTPSVADEEASTSGSVVAPPETSDSAPHHLLATSVSKSLNRAEFLLEELTCVSPTSIASILLHFSASQQMLLANIEDQNKKLGNNEKIERFHKTVTCFDCRR